MNPFVLELSKEKLENDPLRNDELVIEDNIGEAIHIHFRNIRLEMKINEFLKFADNLEDALERLEEWE